MTGFASFADLSQPVTTSDLFLLDRKALLSRASTMREAYRDADPFPHAVIDDFLPTAVAERILAEYPSVEDPVWLDWTQRDTVHQPRKLGIGHADRLENIHAYIQHALFTLNSSPMIQFLEELTGIQGLTPDPHFIGGGLHQILPGGKLMVHSDFNIHPSTRLYRRINVLIYLNKDWLPEYGGDLELWEKSMGHAARTVAPIFNRAVIFNTDHDALHGHPDPLRCPEGMSRKSIALYYYSNQALSGDEAERSTTWRLRPGETYSAAAG